MQSLYIYIYIYFVHAFVGHERAINTVTGGGGMLAKFASACLVQASLRGIEIVWPHLVLALLGHAEFLVSAVTQEI